MMVGDKKSEWMESIPIERPIENWADFNKFVSIFSTASPASLMFMFRGQARADCPLIPSFARYAIAAGLDATKALKLEAVALREFRKQAHLYLPSQMIQPAHDLVAWWTLMQHYNAPTRMLDWTISPFVAAYFAVNHQPDHPGAVWIVRGHTIQEYMTETYKVRFPPMVDHSQEAFLKPDAQPILYASLPLTQTDRMGAQQTLFTVSAQILADHGNIIGDVTRETKADMAFFKLTIDKTLKADFLRQLWQINITARALFPGVDGLGRSVAELVKLGALHESQKEKVNE